MSHPQELTQPLTIRSDKARIRQRVFQDISPEIVLEMLMRVQTYSLAAGQKARHLPSTARVRKRLANSRSK